MNDCETAACKNGEMKENAHDVKIEDLSKADIFWFN